METILDFIRSGELPPEDSIADALSLTSPMYACRLSAMAATFRSVAESDTVWERFLPSDYRQIIARAIDGSDSLVDQFASRKDLFMHLCDHPILIDAGLKSFWLEKENGKKCYMLAARDLSIMWGDAPHYYWQWISGSLPESRFPEAAELIEVCWLEIKGKIHTSMLSPGTKYAAYVVYKTTSSFDGFEKRLIELNLCMTGEEGITNFVSMVPLDGQNPPADPEKHPTRREDGWLEVEIGKFYTLGGENDGDLERILKGKFDANWKSAVIIQEFGEFLVLGGRNDGDLEMILKGMDEVDWKNGIIIQGFEIRPKDSLLSLVL